MRNSIKAYGAIKPVFWGTHLSVSGQAGGIFKQNIILPKTINR
jgi:hypothetical protein